MQCFLFLWDTRVYIGGYIVTFFIVLAGFSCDYAFPSSVIVTWNTGGKYLIYRLSKIWLPHMAAFFCTIPWLVYIHFADWNNLLAYHLFIQSYVPKVGYYFAINGVEWTISAFIGAWLLAPYIIKIIKKMNSIIILFITILMTIIIGIIPLYFEYLQGESGWWATCMNPLLFVIPEFCIGLMLSQFLKRRDNIWKKRGNSVMEFLAILVIIATGIRMTDMIENDNIKFLLFSISMIIVFFKDNGWVSNNIFHKKIFHKLSEISMEVYLQRGEAIY